MAGVRRLAIHITRQRGRRITRAAGVGGCCRSRVVAVPTLSTGPPPAPTRASTTSRRDRRGTIGRPHGRGSDNRPPGQYGARPCRRGSAPRRAVVGTVTGLPTTKAPGGGATSRRAMSRGEAVEAPATEVDRDRATRAALQAAQLLTRAPAHRGAPARLIRANARRRRPDRDILQHDTWGDGGTMRLHGRNRARRNRSRRGNCRQKHVPEG